MEDLRPPTHLMRLQVRWFLDGMEGFHYFHVLSSAAYHLKHFCIFPLTSECGGILSDPAGGNFTSPGYPVSNYSSNLNCEWLIQNPQHVNSSIVVMIEDLHVQSHQTCALDYLQFRLGGFYPEVAVINKYRCECTLFI